jgi:hypothetical protein
VRRTASRTAYAQHGAAQESAGGSAARKAAAPAAVQATGSAAQRAHHFQGVDGRRQLGRRQASGRLGARGQFVGARNRSHGGVARHRHNAPEGPGGWVVDGCCVCVCVRIPLGKSRRCVERERQGQGGKHHMHMCAATTPHTHTRPPTPTHPHSAPDALGDALLRQQSKGARVAGVPQVRAAAELDGQLRVGGRVGVGQQLGHVAADADHANRVGVHLQEGSSVWMEGEGSAGGL